MKKKIVAAVLAFFLGTLGGHRFYLGQIGLGILYLLFSWTGIPAALGIIDAILFLSMDDQEFDQKYNKHIRQADEYDRRTRQEAPRTARTERPRQAAPRNNPHKTSGMKQYKDYDFEGAIQDFTKALAINPRDVAVHFNIACAYSITENKDKAFYHLSKAVENGFDNVDKIREHDALAYLRIQEEFDQFAKNGYRLNPVAKTANAEPEPEISGDLLAQIKRLGEMREKGFLTQNEFLEQKRKLLR